uniref:Cytochrome c peroxidase n=1 Tax=Roseihalotalea indica TaxID=2867963 RepID=A0AA49GNU5_9BACT|nr:cytochrome c peroxidase [Tunicatimonas sp. TK19036]
MISMKRHFLPLIVVFFCLNCAPDHPQDELESSEKAVKIWFVNRLDQLLVASTRLDSLLTHSDQEAEVQQAFKDMRLEYKKIEPLLEHYNPELSKKLNGPALDKHDLHAAERKVWEASGFQVVEEYLFPEWNPDTRQESVEQAAVLHGYLQVYRNDMDGLLLSDRNIFEALRLEILRIMSLGISGFDSPVAFHSIPEAKAALGGMRGVLQHFVNSESEAQFKKLDHALEQAVVFLEQNVSFNEFDRLRFITDHLDRISHELYAFQQQLGVPNNNWLLPVNLEEPSFFSEQAFNADFFAPSFNRDVSSEVVALGKKLFFEPRLSGNDSRSCASCHQPEKAFTDGLSKSSTLDGHGETSRNAPTLVNSTFQRLQFYDSRINFLEGQVADVVANPLEMHGSVEEAAIKLASSSDYPQLFREAFDQDTITAKNLQKAIASYVRSLNGLNAPFDQYLRGARSAMTDAQIKGFNLFMGKAKCATCHFMPLFNGTTPPQYLDTESEVLGVPTAPDTVEAQIDEDLGKFDIYDGELLKYAFKTPTVRNVALTAPYMHNGVYETLEEVVDFYNRGGGAGIGIALENQTLPPDPLNLTKQEQQDLVSFLHALTDTTGLTSLPSRVNLPTGVASNQ